MKLGSKIVLGFIATNVIYVALSIFIFISAQPVRHESTVLSRDLLPMLDLTSQVQYATAMEGHFIQDYSHTIKAETMVEALVYNADIVKSLTYLDKTVASSPALQTPEVLEAIKKIRLSYQQFREMAELLPTRLESINSGLENVLYNHEVFQAPLLEFIAEEERLALAGHEDRLLKLRELEGLGNALMISVMRARFQDQGEFEHSQALAAKATEQAKKLAEGAKNEKMEKFGTTLAGILQEIGVTINALKSDMAMAAEETSRRIQYASATIKHASELRQAADRQSQKVADHSAKTLEQVILFLGLGVLTALIVSSIMALTITRGITRPLNALITKLSGGAMEVDHAAGELSGASSALADGAKENAGSLENISTALEELSSMTQRNAENSVEANTLMNQATEAVDKAENSMNKVITAMQEISSSGIEIAKIIKTIDDIAFQTNLLALNAAVEAARAGEAGSGFAVVADEVRNLASRSAEAARSTAALIDGTINNINSGSELVTLTADNFKTVQGHAGKVAHILDEVAAASKEQSLGIKQINGSMTAMDQITQSNASSADESARSANGLSAQAAELLTAVDELTALVHGQSHGPQVRKLIGR